VGVGVSTISRRDGEPITRRSGGLVIWPERNVFRLAVEMLMAKRPMKALVVSWKRPTDAENTLGADPGSHFLPTGGGPFGRRPEMDDPWAKGQGQGFTGTQRGGGVSDPPPLSKPRGGVVGGTPPPGAFADGK